MLTEHILRGVQEQNPWWRGTPLAVPEFHRDLFTVLLPYVDRKQILSIVGLRRTGKTTLMMQLIAHLLGKTPVQNILFFSFDDITAQELVLEDLLHYFVANSSGMRYAFLDEIHKVPYWQDILKRFYDRGDMKFIVSGSASMKVKKSKESLAGRIFDFTLWPLTFREFAQMKGLQVPEVRFSDDLAHAYEQLLPMKEKFAALFSEYLLKGAFPELIDEMDAGVIRRYIKSSVIEKILFEDIPLVFPVRRRNVLYNILEYACAHTSQLFDLRHLAQAIGVTHVTVQTHLFYLENSFVIDVLYTYSTSLTRRLRRGKKLHIAHPAISIALLNYTQDSLNIGEVAGPLVETAVFQHLKGFDKKLYFWRTPQKDEVDIVVRDERVLPVEVKFGHQTWPKDLKGLVRFMERHDVAEGMCVTRDTFGVESTVAGKIRLVPAWLFLLSAS